MCRDVVPDEVVESLLEPIHGIKELVNSKDPQEREAAHLLKVCSSKPTNRNRK